MDGVRVQQKVYMGYGKAALRVGIAFDVFRPISTVDPLADENKIATVKAAFTRHGAKDFSFGTPSDHKTPLFHGLFDATNFQNFDYFKSANETYCLIALQHLQPPLLFSCPRIVTFSRRHKNAAEGLVAYGAEQTTNVTNTSADDTLASGWPVSIIKSSRGLRDDILPGDVGTGTFEVLAPNIPGVLFRSADIVTDDNGFRYIVQMAEQTDLGWRMLVYSAVM